MYNVPPPYNYCQRSPCYSEGDDRIYKKRRTEITGKQRMAANERERRRMNSINRGFDYLRQRLPSNTNEKKLSKVDTLRGAMEYIRQLQAVLEQQLPNDVKTEHKILIDGVGEDSSLYMVSWRRTPEKYGEIHETSRGPVVYQKDVWVPDTQ
nr:Basic helix-loop-helix dimerisation region bHLH domain containing protein [Haemonchus contortus]